MSYIGSYMWKLRQALGSQPILMPGVGLILVNNEGLLHLGKRAHGGEWSYMGGSVEIGASIMDTVIAEMEEETGVRTVPEDWTFIGIHSDPAETTYTYPNGDVVQIINHMFVKTHNEPLQNGEDEEHTEFGLFALNNLPTPMKPDALISLKLYQAFLQTGKVQVK